MNPQTAPDPGESLPPPSPAAGAPLLSSGAATEYAPRAGFVAAYGLAYFGIFLALLTPVIVTLVVKITSVVPKGQVTGAVSLVLGIGALLALVGNPLFGRLSDRSRFAMGRRRPWMLMGMLVGLIGLMIVALAPSVPVIVLGWCIAQLAYNAALAAAVAVLPDRVPQEKRGGVSGVLGGMLPVAAVVGALLAQLLAPNILLMLLMPGVIGLVAIMWLVSMPEPPVPTQQAPPFSAAEFFGTFVFSPRKNPDFAWAWLSRFLVFLGYSFVLTYQAVILAQHLGATEDEVPKFIFLATLANTVVVLISSYLGGKLSDAIGRRKIFVCAAAALYAVSMNVFIVANEPRDFVIAMGAAGVGFGLYLSTDLALASSLLPDHGADAAKDMGVFNIANTAPQSLAPAIAPIFLGIGAASGENWIALFVAAEVLFGLGALAILPIRSVK